MVKHKRCKKEMEYNQIKRYDDLCDSCIAKEKLVKCSLCKENLLKGRYHKCLDGKMKVI